MGLFEAKTPNTAQKKNILSYCEAMQTILGHLRKWYPAEARIVHLNTIVTELKKECGKIK